MGKFTTRLYSLYPIFIWLSFLVAMSVAYFVHQMRVESLGTLSSLMAVDETPAELMLEPSSLTKELN